MTAICSPVHKLRLKGVIGRFSCSIVYFTCSFVNISTAAAWTATTINITSMQICRNNQLNCRKSSKRRTESISRRGRTASPPKKSDHRLCSPRFIWVFSVQCLLTSYHCCFCMKTRIQCHITLNQLKRVLARRNARFFSRTSAACACVYPIVFPSLMCSIVLDCTRQKLIQMNE